MPLPYGQISTNDIKSYLNTSGAISLLTPAVKQLSTGGYSSSSVSMFNLRGRSGPVSYATFTNGAYSVTNSGVADIWGLTIQAWQVIYQGTYSQNFFPTPVVWKYDSSYNVWGTYSIVTQKVGGSGDPNNYFNTRWSVARGDTFGYGSNGNVNSADYFNMAAYGWSSCQIYVNGSLSVTLTPSGTGTRPWDYREIFATSMNFQLGNAPGNKESQEYFNNVPLGASVQLVLTTAT